MSDAVKFDGKAAKRIDALYQTPDVIGQRQAVLRALGLGHGEQVLDVGAGPGLLAADLAHAVGAKGRVEGIDSSEPMVALARARCAALPWVAFRQGDAIELPYDSQTFDAAVVTQVFEYVQAVDRAIAELHRVLRPGGRVVILDTDWDSVVWQTDDRARMARVMAAWEEHFVHPHLPGALCPLLRRGGFVPDRPSVLALLNTDYRAGTYSAGMITMIRGFVAGRRGVTAAEADAWAEELAARGAAGTYFFSLNRYLFFARNGG
jgi:arsenite methyltransferase